MTSLCPKFLDLLPFTIIGLFFPPLGTLTLAKIKPCLALYPNLFADNKFVGCSILIILVSFLQVISLSLLNLIHDLGLDLFNKDKCLYNPIKNVKKVYYLNLA